METVAIGVREAEALRAALADAVRPLERSGALVRVEERRRGEAHFVSCRLEGDPGSGSAAVAFRRLLADALASWIVDCDQPRLLRRLIAVRYAYLDDSERESVFALVARRLAEGGAGGPGPGAGGAPAWREQVRGALLSYLLQHDTLVLEGFVRFRLKDYVADLAVAVDRAVDAFLMEREYREFIGLLRYFVNSRTDRPPLADCFLRADGGFAVEDEAGCPLPADGLEELDAGEAPAGVAMEDLLVSALISIAPRRVRLHGPGLSADALGSLREVFLGEVEVCGGCGRCAPHTPARGPGEGGDPCGPPPARRTPAVST